MRATKLCIAIGSVLITASVGCGGSTPSAAPPEHTTSNEPAASAPAASEPAAPVSAAEPKADAERPDPEVDVPPEGSSLDRIMRAHFKDALLIREAVIAGRSENVADPAAVIANVQHLENLPEGWQVFVEQMQRTAQRINNSTTASTAAAAAADLGVSCGLCHQRHGGPKPSLELAPAVGTTVESRMKHHIWATERLWEGLSVPSDAAWSSGALALAGDPFPSDFLKAGGVDVRSAAADFTKLAAKAGTKKTIQARAELYAELLVTCGTCHSAIRNKN